MQEKAFLKDKNNLLRVIQVKLSMRFLKKLSKYGTFSVVLQSLIKRLFKGQC